MAKRKAVDVSAKAGNGLRGACQLPVTSAASTRVMIIDGSHHKGDVFATARIVDPCGETH